MALSESDRQRARELAEQAPPPSPELLSRIRAILAGCLSAQRHSTRPAQQDKDGTADAA